MVSFPEVFEMLAERGAARYGEEKVNQLQHALQCASLAERAGASPALITAALLHDIGHLLSDDEGAAARGLDMRHEDSGANALGPLFGADVAEPVRLHVAAKRYLCAINESYFARLSDASVTSLQVQGGAFDAASAGAFAALPHAKAAMALRAWDDQAKDPQAETPGLPHYRDLAETLWRRYSGLTAPRS